jgi:mono/diheme cytochrome c family protein
MKAFVAAVLLIGALVVASTASGQKQKNLGVYKTDALVYAELGKAPEKAKVKRNPMENVWDSAAAGQNLFEQHCSECHGDSGEGTRKAPSLRAAEVQNAAPGAIFWVLTNGLVRRGMPVWSKLPEPQRWQLVTFIKSMGVAANAVNGKGQP